MKTKEEILDKYGFINGISIHSNTHTIEKNLHDAMEEYANQKKLNEINYPMDLKTKALKYLNTFNEQIIHENIGFLTEILTEFTEQSKPLPSDDTLICPECNCNKAYWNPLEEYNECPCGNTWIN